MKREYLEKIYKMARNDTTVAINGKRREALKDAAVEVTIATKEPTKVSAIVQYLIDHYLEEAVKDMKAKK